MIDIFVKYWWHPNNSNNNNNNNLTNSQLPGVKANKANNPKKYRSIQDETLSAIVTATSADATRTFQLPKMVGTYKSLEAVSLVSPQSSFGP